jgi:hypothetical protein
MSVRIDNSVQGPITLRKTDNSVCDIDDRGLTGLRSRSHGSDYEHTGKRYLRFNYYIFVKLKLNLFKGNTQLYSIISSNFRHISIYLTLMSVTISA